MSIQSDRWDVFAKVVDNFGDAGVAWRLARQLVAEHGMRVTLLLDDLAALAQLVPELAVDKTPQTIHGVRLVSWDDPADGIDDAAVVVEAFGCGVPHHYLHRAATRQPAPRWFVLEYLSAEAWVDDAHSLPSPHPRLPLLRQFWFPGFTRRTGGLLRESDLLSARDAFQANRGAQETWARSQGVQWPADDALRISLFCYPHHELPGLFSAWGEGETPIACIVPRGVADPALAAWCGGRVPHPGDPPIERGALRLQTIAFLSQEQYDRLLWWSDLNFVRGEDSFIRAQWAARPFIWQAYRQEGQAHLAKVDAFLDRYAKHLPWQVAQPVRDMTALWNGAAGKRPIGVAWLEFAGVCPHLRRHGPLWANELASLPELASGLVKAAQVPI